MAAKPHLLSLTALLGPALAAGCLSGGILLLPPAAGAQTVIGGPGNGGVQINLQALDQLGGGYAVPGYGAASDGAPAFTYPAVTGRPPLPGEGAPPKPLIGETGGPRGLHLQARRKTMPASALASAPMASEPVEKTPAKRKVAAPKPAAMPAKPADTAVASAAAPVQTAPAAAPAAPIPVTPPAATETAPSAPAAAVASAPVATPAEPKPAMPAAAPQAITPAPVAPTPAPAPKVATAPVMPKPATPSNPASQQSALVAPKPVPAPSAQGGMVTIPFAADQAEMPKSDLAALDALAQQLAGNEDRLQIRAYAASTGTDGSSGARRLSLSRALAVRAYLIDKGIRSTRIDVRALGTPTDGGAADRVEVAPVGH